MKRKVVQATSFQSSDKKSFCSLTLILSVKLFVWNILHRSLIELFCWNRLTLTYLKL